MWFCFRVLREHWFGIGSHFKYQCCKDSTVVVRDSTNGHSISCDVPVSESRWLAVFNGILAILVGVTVLYWPRVFYLLPRSFLPDNSYQIHMDSNKEISSRQIHIDDNSPITLQTFLQELGELFPNDIVDLRSKLGLIWFGFIPIFFYT